jgi:hypothetical protein
VAFLAIFPVPNGHDFLLAAGTRLHTDDSNSQQFRFEFCRFDGDTFQYGPLASPLPTDLNPLVLQFVATEDGLLAFFQVKRARLGAWAWPELKPIWNAASIPFDSCWDLKCSTKELFAVAAYDGTIFVGDVVTGKWLHSMKPNDDAIRHLAFSGDGKFLVGTDYEDEAGTIRIWNTDSWQLIREVKTSVRYCGATHVSPDNKLLGVQADRCCLFWNFESLTN